MKLLEPFLLILRSSQQLFMGQPLLPVRQEEARVLLWLNLGRISQVVSPVPTQLLLLRLVLLVM